MSHLFRDIVHDYPRYWGILRDAAIGYWDDNALSRGAAIAYYTIFSIGPVLLIVVAIAGFFFGEQAAQGAILNQLTGLMGHSSATAIEGLIHSAHQKGAGTAATIIGIITLLLTATGVFAEMQADLNAIWKAAPQTSAITALIRVRMASLGLVGALGFLLLVSLAVSSGLQAAASYLHTVSTVFDVVLRIITFLISFALITVMFAAIYKVLPDRQVEWRDVLTGAVVTALLFTIGKFLISLYIGGAAIASTYGAAGSLLVFLIWVYYSAQIFLFGAEFTRAFAETKGSDAPEHQQVGIPDQPGDMKPTSQVGSVKP